MQNRATRRVGIMYHFTTFFILHFFQIFILPLVQPLVDLCCFKVILLFDYIFIQYSTVRIEQNYIYCVNLCVFNHLIFFAFSYGFQTLNYSFICNVDRTIILLRFTLRIFVVVNRIICVCRNFVGKYRRVTFQFLFFSQNIFAKFKHAISVVLHTIVFIN